MNGGTLPYYGTATGNVGGADGGQVASATITPAAALSTLTLREDGSGGTVIAVLQAGASGSSFQARFCGLGYKGQLHATLSGAGASFVVEL
jgi:hypothetical protein